MPSGQVLLPATISLKFCCQKAKTLTFQCQVSHKNQVAQLSHVHTTKHAWCWIVVSHNCWCFVGGDGGRVKGVIFPLHRLHFALENTIPLWVARAQRTLPRIMATLERQGVQLILAEFLCPAARQDLSARVHKPAKPQNLVLHRT